MFPAVIDNNIRKKFVACPTKVKWAHIENLRPITESTVDMHFGRCFAHGVEWARKAFYYSGESPANAVDIGITAAVSEWGDFAETSKSNKTLGSLVTSLRYYFETWPLGEDGLTPVENGIECGFKRELPIMHPDTGEPLCYAGRMDFCGMNDEGNITIIDEKTTGRLGDSWWQQWDLDAQMTGYIWAMQEELSLNRRGTIEISAQIRGISVLKGDNGHVEVPITRTLFMVNRWYEQMLRDVTRMIASYKSGIWDFNLSDSCTSYNRPCEFTQLCLRPNPEQHIEGAYKVVVWNPLNH